MHRLFRRGMAMSESRSGSLLGVSVGVNTLFIDIFPHRSAGVCALSFIEDRTFELDV